MSSRLRDLTEFTEDEARDDTHHIYKQQVRRCARMCAPELASCVSAESKTLTKVQDPKHRVAK